MDRLPQAHYNAFVRPATVTARNAAVDTQWTADRSLASVHLKHLSLSAAWLVWAAAQSAEESCPYWMVGSRQGVCCMSGIHVCCGQVRTRCCQELHTKEVRNRSWHTARLHRYKTCRILSVHNIRLQPNSRNGRRDRSSLEDRRSRAPSRSRHSRHHQKMT